MANKRLVPLIDLTEFRDEFGGRFPALVAAFLQERGFHSMEDLNSYLNADDSSLRVPGELKGAVDFANTLLLAIIGKQEITVYGDYDADGILATFIVMCSIWHINPRTKVNWFINNRFMEGYGVNEKGLDRLLQEYPDTDLIVTVDNGISAAADIHHFLESHPRRKIIVSDHHVQMSGMPLPRCSAVVDEKRRDENPEKDTSVCGAELARLLMILTFYFTGRPFLQRDNDFFNDMAVFSGMATITDSAPMTKANRFVAGYAMNRLREIAAAPDKAEGYAKFWAMLLQMTDTRNIDSKTFGFTFGPLFNAAGRVLGTAELPMELLLAAEHQDFDTCWKKLTELISLNQERKERAREIDAEIAAEIEDKHYDRANCLLIARETGGEGFNGPAASRLVDLYQVPAIVLSPMEDNPDLFKGSGRSVKGFNLLDCLSVCEKEGLVASAGGHAMAAGMTIRRDKIELLRKRLNELAGQACPDRNLDERKVDFALSLDDLSFEMLDSFRKLDPFGPGFEAPDFGFHGKLLGASRMSEDKDHVVLEIHQNNPQGHVKVIWWHGLECCQEMHLNPGTDVAFTGIPEIHKFNGTRSLQVILNHIWPAAEEAV